MAVPIGGLMFTEEQLRKALKEWSVSDEEANELIGSMNGEDPNKQVQATEGDNGGEPAPKEDGHKDDNANATEGDNGGEPAPKEDNANGDNAIAEKDKRIEELQSQYNDLKNSQEGISASLKRIEELIGSFGKKVDGGKQPPYGDINSSNGKDAKGDGSTVEESMDFLARLAGKR